MSFEDQGGRACSSATDNRHLKSLVKQNPYQSVSDNECQHFNNITLSDENWLGGET